MEIEAENRDRQDNGGGNSRSVVEDVLILTRAILTRYVQGQR